MVKVELLNVPTCVYDQLKNMLMSCVLVIYLKYNIILTLNVKKKKKTNCS